MSDDPGGSEEGSFAKRLESARTRRGLDKPVAVAAAVTGPSPMGVGIRVGVELVSALGVGLLIGWGIDWLLHTRPVFICVFALLGGVAGILNVWRAIAPKPGTAGRD